MTFPYAKPPGRRRAPDGYFEARTEAFVKVWKNADERGQGMMAEMHAHFEAEVERLVAAGNEPQNIAHSLHGLIDESVARTLKTKDGQRVQCSRGCAACCHLYVNITREEAVLLLVYAGHARIEIDWAKVERQAGRDLGQWDKHGTGERRCVFLGKDNACRVYEHRPASCRKYMVVSKPALCDTERNPGREVAILAAWEAEVIASAMRGPLRNASMPRMLLEAKENAS